MIYAGARRQRAPPGPRAGRSPPLLLGHGSRRSPGGLARGPQAGEGDVMATLPARPDLGQLRRQAKDLLRAAQAGDTTAAARIRAMSGRQTLAGAQLAVAREYGFASWRALKTAVEVAAMDLAQQAEAFCAASIGDWTGK